MSDAPSANPRPWPRLIICDVDGVVFRGQFLLALAGRVGRLAWLTSVRDCLLYEWGRIPLEELLRRVYGRAAGRPKTLLREAYDSLPLTANVAETIRALRDQGHEVWLASAGVPQEMVDDLVGRTDADGGVGIEAECEGDVFTGRIAGDLSETAGKLQFAERLMAERGIEPSRLVVVGDDRNNLELLERAGVSIGFHATYGVRRRVRFLAEGDDFAEVARFVNRRPGPPRPPPRRAAPETAPARRWMQEIRRKLVHAMAAVIPMVHRRSPAVVSFLLLLVGALYLVSEFFRLNGSRFPVFGRIMRWTIRRRERRRLALGPVTLALGVIGSLWLFRAPVAYAAILIAALSDSVAAVVGTHWGRLPLPHNRYKSVEGTAAGLAAAFCCAWTHLPIHVALATAFVASAVESLDIGDWDNLLVPLACGAAATALLAL